MVTSCVAVAVLPEASVTVHVTVVLPAGNMKGASLVTVLPGQLSPNVARPQFTLSFEVSHFPASVLAITSDGAVINGFSSSTTVTLNEAVSPVAAVNCTVVVPIGNNEPEAGIAVTAAHPNVEVMSKLTSAPH